MICVRGLWEMEIERICIWWMLRVQYVQQLTSVRTTRVSWLDIILPSSLLMRLLVVEAG